MRNTSFLHRERKIYLHLKVLMGMVKRYVYRLNQTQTICNGDTIRNKERMPKMKWQSDQKKNHGIAETSHCVREKKKKSQAKRIKITLFAVLAKIDYFKKFLDQP